MEDIINMDTRTIIDTKYGFNCKGDINIVPNWAMKEHMENVVPLAELWTFGDFPAKDHSRQMLREISQSHLQIPRLFDHK